MKKLNLKKDSYLFITLKTVCDEESEVVKTNRSVDIETHEDGNKYYHLMACWDNCEMEVWFPCYRWHIASIENAEY